MTFDTYEEQNAFQLILFSLLNDNGSLNVVGVEVESVTDFLCFQRPPSMGLEVRDLRIIFRVWLNEKVFVILFFYLSVVIGVHLEQWGRLRNGRIKSKCRYLYWRCFGLIWRWRSIF